jgi:hypothetical protein
MPHNPTPRSRKNVWMSEPRLFPCSTKCPLRWGSKKKMLAPPQAGSKARRSRGGGFLRSTGKGGGGLCSRTHVAHGVDSAQAPYDTQTNSRAKRRKEPHSTMYCWWSFAAALIISWHFHVKCMEQGASQDTPRAPAPGAVSHTTRSIAHRA